MSALERYKEQVETLKARAARARAAANETSAEIMDSGVMLVSAYAWGAYEKRQRAAGASTQIAGLDGDVVIAALGFVGGEVLDGDSARIARGIGRAAGCLAAYKRGMT